MINVVYMGTPDFSVAPLKKLTEFPDEFRVIAVATNNDKPIGRKQVLTPSPVKVEALKNGIAVYTYEKIRFEGVEDLKKLNPDVIVTCAFGQILSKEIINIPKFGVINLHASLLPKYRGASPVHYAIMNGEKETGVTVMKTDVGIDTGDILMSEKVKINDGETTGELFERLSFVSADLLIKALRLIVAGKAVFVPQNDDFATTTKIIKKEDAKIDWAQDAETIVNKIRAYNPSPVAFTFLNDLALKIYQAEKVEGSGKCGEVIVSDKKLVIAAKNGAVSVKVLQKAGGKAISAEDFLRGNKIEKGLFLG